MADTGRNNQATIAGTLIGAGMGGFVDGIMLHQILQWHNMISNLLPPDTMETMKVNMVWDGAFHALVWIVALVGILMLWAAAYCREAMPSRQRFMGRSFSGGGCLIWSKGSSTTRFSRFIMSA